MCGMHQIEVRTGKTMAYKEENRKQSTKLGKVRLGKRKQNSSLARKHRAESKKPSRLTKGKGLE